MTDFYTDTEGINDSIVISGKNLPSKEQNNAPYVGQIAYKSIYFNKNNDSLFNLLSSNDTQWKNLKNLNYDITLKELEKVIATSSIKYVIDGKIQEQIYIITNDESIDVNKLINIPYYKHDHTLASGFPKFHVYSAVIHTYNYYGQALTYLQKCLNPQSIYGTVIANSDPTKDEVTAKNTFNAETSSFVFMFGINKPKNEGADNLCFIAENQHYHAQSPGSTTLPNNSSAFDKPIIIQYDTTTADKSSVGTYNKYLGVNATLEDSLIMNNFLIKTIAINPLFKTNDGKNDSNFLI